MSIPLSPQDLAEVRAYLADPTLHHGNLEAAALAWDLLKEAQGRPIDADRWVRIDAERLGRARLAWIGHPASPLVDPRPPAPRPAPGLAARFVARMGLFGQPERPPSAVRLLDALDRAGDALTRPDRRPGSFGGDAA